MTALALALGIGCLIGLAVAHVNHRCLIDRVTDLTAQVTRQHRQIAKLRTQVRNLDDDLSAVEGQLETFEPTDEGWQESDDADAWKYK